jgi:zinc/manganese transport system ATP-binding protein
MSKTNSCSSFAHFKGMIEINDLTVYYRDHLALQDLSGVLQAGSLTAVVGPNGGGKSTFLKALIGLIPSVKGQINYHNLILKDIAYLPQQTEIDRGFPLRVQEVVALGLCHQQGFYKALSCTDIDEIKRALEGVEIASCMDRSLNTLSGGQFQRVLFARLAVQKAPVILLDEPFAAVDAHTVEDLMKILLKWNAQGKTVIVVSHDLDLVRQHFPQSILLAQKCLGWGRTEEVVTLENFRAAKKLSRNWENCLESSDDSLLTTIR